MKTGIDPEEAPHSPQMTDSNDDEVEVPVVVAAPPKRAPKKAAAKVKAPKAQKAPKEAAVKAPAKKTPAKKAAAKKAPVKSKPKIVEPESDSDSDDYNAPRESIINIDLNTYNNGDSTSSTVCKVNGQDIPMSLQLIIQELTRTTDPARLQDLSMKLCSSLVECGILPPNSAFQ